MLNRCSRPKPNVLFINSYEPTKMWNLTSEMVFTQYGMVNTQTIQDVGDQISATKFHTKVTIFDGEEVQHATTQPPLNNQIVQPSNIHMNTPRKAPGLFSIHEFFNP